MTPFDNNPISYLVEAAKMELANDTASHLTESSILREMDSIEEVSVNPVMEADMVPVLKIDNSYLVEMNTLLPFMEDHDIRSVAKALDAIAEANMLDDKMVGLLIESDECVSSMIEKASAKAKAGNKKAQTGILGKLGNITDLSSKLKSKGYPVKKKKSSKKKSKSKKKK